MLYTFSAAILVALGLVVTTHARRPGVTLRNALRIRAGQTLRQIEHVFGLPAGEENMTAHGPQAVWRNSSSFAVFVLFDRAGRVEGAAICERGRFRTIDIRNSRLLTTFPWLRI